jgi:hypothetical protein
MFINLMKITIMSLVRCVLDRWFPLHFQPNQFFLKAKKKELALLMSFFSKKKRDKNVWNLTRYNSSSWRVQFEHLEKQQ